MQLTERLNHERLLLDGGSGTELCAMGLPAGTAPEQWNITHQSEIKSLALSYFKAGSQIVCANTFGVNPLKYDADTVEKMVCNALGAAKNAREEAGFTSETHYVALDIGPLGKLLRPFGDLDFEEAVSAFATVVRLGVKYGADLITIETMNDCFETKAAVIAAKENSSLPVFVTNVYDESGKLMTGADIGAMVAMLEGLSVDAIGMNCSLGPKQMLRLVSQFMKVSSLPVIVKPNAGLPRFIDDKTVYDVDADEFASLIAQAAESGASLIGGCCGTTPLYIEKIKTATANIKFVPQTFKHDTVVSSYTHALTFGERPLLIGERINPTGKAKLKEALRGGNISYILGEAVAEDEHGADALDVNAGLPEIDETAVLANLIKEIQAVTSLPLQIDTSDANALSAAMRIYGGKPLVNSVNGKKEVMDAVFPAVKKYGGTVIALSIDENGIPETARGRADIIKKIIGEASKYGINKKDIIADPLTMTISADKNNAKITLDALRIIRGELGIKTSLGVSNISFGLPNRDFINAAFFTMALDAGLDAAIMNPFSTEMMKAFRSSMLLYGKDEGCRDYIAFASGIETSVLQKETDKKEESKEPLRRAIVRGLKSEAASQTEILLTQKDALDIINSEIIPALNEVGKGFEEKTVYLPELLMSAEAAAAAFDKVKAAMPRTENSNRNEIILATVKGDIHDIGKNIVRVLLENFGFDVIDLGRDVPPEKIAETAREKKIRLVGLSALMTTTVPSMAETIRLLRVSSPDTKIVVGGAVLTGDYAKQIGADFYAADAMETVRIAENLLK